MKLSQRKQSRLPNIMSTTALSTVLALAASPVLAQTKPAQNAGEQSVEEVVVTGSRIVREGYEAPTPLTVVGVEQLQNSANPNIINYLNDLPALAGTFTSNSSSTYTTTASAGTQSVNLRGLGNNRTLVLMDGRRVVGVDYSNSVNTASLPQQLIERVDMVTGGASAVYGSDAVAGVVNFILNKKFTGVKGEISGGVTNYGDDKNYKIDLSAGFGFGADNRGHVLLSGEHLFNEGIPDGYSRPWNRVGTLMYANPAYGTGAGQSTSVPQQLVMDHSSLAVSTFGGIIVSGPLKGTAFGQNGTPYKFQYGSIVGSTTMTGGDWQTNDARRFYWLDTNQQSDNLFTRVAYDITDDINAFVQYDYAWNHSRNKVNHYWFLGNLTVAADNAYIPASTRAAMAANGLTQIAMGTWNLDLDAFGPDNTWITHRVDAGLEGKVAAFGSDWHWNLGYSFGSTKDSAHSGINAHGDSIVTSLYRQSIDAVVNPATGQIVCRVALTNPASTCKPWNLFGTGVNPSSSASFLRPSFQFGTVELQSYTAGVSGEVFSLPAGPVGMALSFEHRKDEIHAIADPNSVALDRPTTNHSSLNGKQSVTEGAVEFAVPLAKGESWAQAWDISLAARFTGYELSGYVTTWKLGTTYAPIDDVKFRVTYSRDIRAPTLQDLFATPNGSGAGVITDPKPPVSVSPTGSPAAYAIGGKQIIAGNANLTPEKANTLGVGVVLTPTFIEGFTASVDYWDVKLKEAIYTLTSQQVVDLCYTTAPSLCSAVTRDAQGKIFDVTSLPFNLAIRNVSGVDLEATYKMPLSRVIDDWRGDFSLHGNMTIYIRDYQDNRFSPPVDRVGELVPHFPNFQPPRWRYTISGTYTLDPVVVGVTMRGIASGTIDNSYVVCTTGCPVSTAAATTINMNHVPGATYFDANVNYNLNIGETTQSQLFFSVKNIFNKAPPWTGGSFLNNQIGQGSFFDSFGSVYRVGLRFKM